MQVRRTYVSNYFERGGKEMLRKREKPETVDLSNSGITVLNRASPHTTDHVTELSLNYNELYTLEGISTYTNLQKLSARHNHLVDLANVTCLHKLTHLDLQHNSLTDITAVGNLLCLRWACLAGNSIQHYASLSNSRQLQHIDLSNNCIGQLEDISSLHNLAELLLSGNIIAELNRLADFLPRSLTFLSLSDNELSDISHLVQLSCLSHLQRLSLSGNPFLLPCHQLGVDYKPFVLCCCTAVKFLDGVAVAEVDRVVAANIFMQGTELHRMTQTQILQQLMQQHRTKSPSVVQYPSNNNSLLFVSQRSPASHDVTAGSPTLYNLANDENIVMVKSPQMEHTTPFMHITNGDVCDFQSLPSVAVTETLQQQQQQQQGESQSLPQRKQDTSQLHSTAGVDAVLAKKVTLIQAHVRGHLTRKHMEPLKVQIRAATTIQAYWRGHVTRSRNPVVIRCYAELERRKMHRHIIQLSSRLNSYQTELTHNAHMMQIQDETIRSLASEVEELQQSRDHMITQQRGKAAIVIQKYWRGYQVRKFTKVTMAAPHKLSTLWSMCQQLKSQVEELQHAMATMATKADVLTMKQNSLSNVNCLPPPSHLQMTHYSNTCLLLEWSSQAAPPTSEATPTLLGYRVYVNGIAEGQVGSNKKIAYLEGLDPAATYRITVRSVYAEGESVDSNPVIASLSNNLSRDSSMMITPHSSFPPSPEKSIVTMTIKEEEDKIEDHQTDHEVNQDSYKVSMENEVDDLVRENPLVKEDTYSTHTASSTSSSEDLNDPVSTVQELRNTFTVTQESNPEEQLDDHISLKGNPHNIVLHESSHDDRTQGNSHSVLEGNSHESEDTTTTQGTDATRENPLSVQSDNVLQIRSQSNSLESLQSTLTISSSDSPVATPTSSHSPTFQQSVKQRRSFFPPIMDFEDKSTDNPVQNDETTGSSSKELATQLLSALEKELSNPLLKPTTCT